MADARYFRSQAELCVQLAQLISNRMDADKLRATAVQYTALADTLETERAPTLSASKSPDE